MCFQYDNFMANNLYNEVIKLVKAWLKWSYKTGKSMTKYEKAFLTVILKLYNGAFDDKKYIFLLNLQTLSLFLITHTHTHTIFLSLSLSLSISLNLSLFPLYPPLSLTHKHILSPSWTNTHPPSLKCHLFQYRTLFLVHLSLYLYISLFFSLALSVSLPL